MLAINMLVHEQIESMYMVSLAYGLATVLHGYTAARSNFFWVDGTTASAELLLPHSMVCIHNAAQPFSSNHRLAVAPMQLKPLRL